MTSMISTLNEWEGSGTVSSEGLIHHAQPLAHTSTPSSTLTSGLILVAQAGFHHLVGLDGMHVDHPVGSQQQRTEGEQLQLARLRADLC